MQSDDGRQDILLAKEYREQQERIEEQVRPFYTGKGKGQEDREKVRVEG
ncbi:hypothetical protein ME803_10120 [Lactobacillus delbrueckii]|nr:hypothetical protein ME803_10120 [Lactobacillus delbrueckii]